jgi:PEP-CTERM motif
LLTFVTKQTVGSEKKSKRACEMPNSTSNPKGVQTMKFTKTVAAACLLAASALAGAQTIDFNELAFDGYYKPVAPITTQGFQFTNSDSNSLGVWGRNEAYQADVGYASVFVNYGNSTTTMSKLDSGSFDFYSIDLADVYNSGASVVIDFLFNDMNNNSFSQTVTLDRQIGLETFVFNQTGMKSVSWQTVGGDNGWNQFDNVNVSSVSAVPEPESYALMLAGLGLVGAIARRRKAA